jgi:hypothetical protein
MEKEQLIEFIFKLFGLSYKEETHSSVLIFGVQSVVLGFQKGQTTVDKIISFQLDFKSNSKSIALPIFGIVDTICKEYGVRVKFEDNIFKFMIDIEGHW